MAATSVDQLLAQATDKLQTRRFAQAERFCLQALAMQPMHAEALHLMGLAAHRLGRSEEAIGWLEKSVAVDPNQARAQNNLGEVLRTLGRIEHAIAAYQRAVAVDPAYPDARRNLAQALFQSGDIDGSVAEGQAALQLSPKDPRVLNTLASAYAHQGKLDEALGLLSQSIQLQPDRPATHSILGLVLAQRGDTDAAMKAYEAAIRLRPTDGDAHTGLANVLSAQGRLTEALDAARRAIELSPRNTDYYVNLANILCRRGQVAEGIESYRAALAIAPDSQPAHDGLLLTLHYDPATSPADLIAAHRHWGQSLTITPAVHVADRDIHRKVRIGYASPDFREHPISFFIEPILASHNHDAFTIICYSDVRKPDDLTKRLQTYADEWRSTVGISDERWAQVVRDDRIDILIDLANHTADNRMRGFARKPARVQVSYLAYPGTSGLPAMDVKISDRFIDPPGENESSTESIARLSRSYFCYRPDDRSPPVSETPVLRADHITFGSVNTLKKINPAVIEMWSNLLRAVPSSRLILQALGLDDPATRQLYIDAFARHGIDGARLELSPFGRFIDFLNLFSRIDVALDPFPYNGGTTTLHTLWMGVPVVTLSGANPVSRMGRSVLTNLELSELIAGNEEEYIAAAKAQASDVDRLREVRGTMRDRMRASPVMDAKALTLDLETIYRRM